VVLIPEVTLNWTPSPTPDVTGYTVERASGGGWTVVADLSGRTSASWADTSVSGGRSYTYEVVASSPSGSSASAPASATTPSLCL
jgi:hypothetical protein